MSENLDLIDIAKQIVILLIISLIIGVVVFILIRNIPGFYGLTRHRAGISWISFVIGVLVASCVIGLAKEDRIQAGIFGLIIGLLTSLFEGSAISLAVGQSTGELFRVFIGNQTLLLMVVGLIFAVVANLIPKDKVPQNEFLDYFK